MENCLINYDYAYRFYSLYFHRYKHAMLILCVNSQVIFNIIYNIYSFEEFNELAYALKTR